MKEHSNLKSEEQMMLRICREYLEMPGMWLTRRQAQRLFGLAEHVCARLLDDLVARKFLARQSNGAYGRLSDGTADLAAILRGETVSRLGRPA